MNWLGFVFVLAVCIAQTLTFDAVKDILPTERNDFVGRAASYSGKNVTGEINISEISELLRKSGNNGKFPDIYKPILNYKKMEISIARKKIKKFSNKKFRKAQFNIFRATMSKKMKVSKDMFSVPGVKEYFRKEFLDKRIRFDPKLKDDEVRTIARNLSDIWCAYCTQTNNCPCIKIYCFIVNC